MYNALRAKVAERRARLDDLERERVILVAELNAYEDALAIVEAEMPMASVYDEVAEAEKRSRRVSQEWAGVLGHFAKRHPAVFSLDDVLAFGAGVGFHPSRGNVRSQMAACVGRGVLERVSEGVFRLTPKGLAEIAPERGRGGTDAAPSDAPGDGAADPVLEPAA